MGVVRHHRQWAAFLRPPLVLLLGVAVVVAASPLEECVGEPAARFLAALAFNLVLLALMKARVPAAPRPLLCVVALATGVLVGLPTAVGSPVETASFTTVSVLALVLSAGWEELLFRGLVLDYAARQYGRWGAVAMSSLFFAGAHMLDASAGAIVGASYLVLAGVTLGALRFASGSLWPPIALHVGHNLVLAGTRADEPSPMSLALVAATAVVGVYFTRPGVRVPSKSDV